MSLDVFFSDKDYLELFLNETKAYVPFLIQLTVCDRQLKLGTENFTRQAARRNCIKLNQLIIIQLSDNLEDRCYYSPSLKMYSSDVSLNRLNTIIMVTIRYNNLRSVIRKIISRNIISQDEGEYEFLQIFLNL